MTLSKKTSVQPTKRCELNGHAMSDPPLRFSMSSDAEKLVAPHFRVKEFACRITPGKDQRAEEVLIHPALPCGLETLREELRKQYPNATCTINSGYRTVAYNKLIGGASQSRHTVGQAADIVFKDGGKQISPAIVANIAEKIGFGGVGRYQTFTHVDVSNKRNWSGGEV